MAVTMTSIRLDTHLADEAAKVLGAKSRTEAVHAALREIVAWWREACGAQISASPGEKPSHIDAYGKKLAGVGPDTRENLHGHQTKRL